MSSALADRYQEISTRIHSALHGSARRDSVVFIAVSKVQSLDAIQTLYDLGQRDFGENYAQELIEKAEHFLVKESATSAGTSSDICNPTK